MSGKRNATSLVESTSQTRSTTGNQGRSRRIEIRVEGEPIVVTPELEALVQRACESACELPEEMTTTQSAEFLDVSRPFIIKLINTGELPCRMVGTHRRIPTVALLAYKKKMFQKASQALEELAHASQEMGLYDADGSPTRK